MSTPAASAPPGVLGLVPVGPLAPRRAEDLVERLSRRTPAAWRVEPPLPDATLPRLPGRGQVDASSLLAALETRASPGSIVLGVTHHDVAIPIFTFVLGLARPGGRAALISLARLDPTFYGLPEDPGRLAARATLEALHELGHVAGLAHCREASCLMSFAASVERVDVRGEDFCGTCAALLPPWLHPRGARRLARQEHA
jgi:archaemetzincin